MQFVAIMRCRTWNVWPENTVIEHYPFLIELEGASPIVARAKLVSYLNRIKQEDFSDVATSLGPLVWDGVVPGLHLVRDSVLKAPEDTVAVSMVHRNAWRGEIDILISFEFDGEIPPSLEEAVRA